ncbi:hypothetical protein AB6D11_00445 [Vibrio splendidus]
MKSEPLSDASLFVDAGIRDETRSQHENFSLHINDQLSAIAVLKTKDDALSIARYLIGRLKDPSVVVSMKSSSQFPTYSCLFDFMQNAAVTKRNEASSLTP